MFGLLTALWSILRSHSHWNLTNHANHVDVCLRVLTGSTSQVDGAHMFCEHQTVNDNISQKACNQLSSGPKSIELAQTCCVWLS